METIDTKIEAIRDAIGSLPYFSKALGRSWKFREKTADKKVKISPSVILKNNDLEIIRPDDKEKGILFFYVKDKAVSSNYNPSVMNWYKYPVDIIIWINSEKQTDWKGLEECLFGIRSKLKEFPMYSITAIGYEAETIFEGFTLEEAERQYFCHPYYGARITGFMDLLENDCTM